MCIYKLHYIQQIKIEDFKTMFTNYFNRTTENSQLTFRRVARKLCAANHSLSRSSLLTVSTCSMGRAMVSILLTLSYALSRSWVTEICQYFYFQLLLNFSNRFFLLFSLTFFHIFAHSLGRGASRHVSSLKIQGKGLNSNT